MISKIVLKFYIKCQDYLLKHTDYLDYDFTLIDKDFTNIRVGDYEHGEL